MILCISPQNVVMFNKLMLFYIYQYSINDSQLHTFLLLFVMKDPLRALEESVIYKSQSLTLCRLTHLPLVGGRY